MFSCIYMLLYACVYMYISVFWLALAHHLTSLSHSLGIPFCRFLLQLLLYPVHALTYGYF